VSEDFLQGENLRSTDRAMTMLVHCFLLKGVAFEEAGLLVLFGGVSVATTRN
jgi:hypothetical protein